MNNTINTKQKKDLFENIMEIVNHSKLTLITTSLSFLLYFIFNDGIYLFILAILGSFYLVILFPMQLPEFFTGNIRSHPYMSSDLELPQKEKLFPKVLAIIFELSKALFMTILGFGIYFRTLP